MTQPEYQLGARQMETWSKMTEAQRIEANRLMETMSASKAFAQAPWSRA